MMRKRFLQGRRSLGLAMAFVLCSGLPVYAVTPDIEHASQIAGQVEDSVKDRQIVIPQKVNVQIEVSGEQAEEQPSSEGAKFHVKGYHITGILSINELALREDKLQELVKDATDKDLTLSELQGVARRIAKQFRAQGYMVARAYIPPQNIVDGTVEIVVVPGKYENIEVRNHARISDSMVRKMLGGVKTGSYVEKAKLERALLLLSDIGGISIKATLAPGQAGGTSDLIVEIGNTDALTAQLALDNAGNRFTGKNMRSFDLEAHNVTGHGDQASVHVDNSGGGLTNAGVDYVLPLGGKGLKLGIGYEQLRYRLGQEFDALDAYGTAKDTKVYLAYPLVRSRNRNLYAQIGYTNKRLEDRIENQNDAFNQRHANVWTIGLNGDSRDNVYGGGVTNYALTLSSGQLNLDGGHDAYGTSTQTNDDTGPHTAGHFTKTNLNVSRLQHLGDRTNLYLGFSGQMASKNLDSAEKMYLGGANGVRAYPQGEASGDQGYLFTAELRYQLKNPHLQLAAFFDHGYVNGNKDDYAGAAENRSLSGAGLGLIYSHRKDYSLRLDYAWKLGSEEATSDTDKNGRFWVRGVQYF